MALIERLLPSPDVAALLGDINEEARHRSRLWYWGQIAAVVVIGLFREVAGHPLLAVRAIGLGIVALAAYIALWVGLFYGLQQFFYAFPDSFILNQFSLNQFSDTVSRWIIAGVWLTFLGGFSLCGWTVGRLHRSHGIALVLPFAGLIALITIYLLARVGPDSRLISTLKFIHVASIPAIIVIGGYWSTRRASTR
jgi:hypothetical protein